MSFKSTSLQKIGLAIVALSIIALIVSFNENDFTLSDLETMEGKVTDVRFVKVANMPTRSSDWIANLRMAAPLEYPGQLIIGNRKTLPLL